jgi:hypothetical protein
MEVGMDQCVTVGDWGTSSMHAWSENATGAAPAVNVVQSLKSMNDEWCTMPQFEIGEQLIAPRVNV